MWNTIKTKMRRWMNVLFGKNKKLQEIVKTQVSEEHYKRIDVWKALYAGYYEDFHRIKYHTIDGQKTRTMKSLNMAKVVSQELAKIIFTENVQINISDTGFKKNIDDSLKLNRFYKVFQGKLEQMFGLGGLVLKAHPKELPLGSATSHKLVITYVTPDCFIPLSYEADEIIEGVFLTITKKEKKTYCLFEFHKWEVVTVPGEDGGEPTSKKVYTITNELYERDHNSTDDAKKVDLDILYPELEEHVGIENLTQPLFQYIRPNIANNFDLQSPMGISIFANSLDVLYAIDTAFDSFVREFRMGKRKVIVPAQAIKSVIDPTTGETSRYFDANDEAYQAFNFADPEKQKIQDNTVSLRVDEHVAGINALLNLLAMQTGFSAGTFTFDGQGLKTATEVVSENSKTYQTKQVNEQFIEEGLSKFIHTLGEVAALYEIFDAPSEDYDIEFYWDDTIVKDKYTDSDFYIKLKNAGIVTSKYALMKILDFTEEDADQMMKDIQEQNKSMNPDVDSIIGGEFE
jgi:A118 family predicted phage portal protein